MYVNFKKFINQNHFIGYHRIDEKTENLFLYFYNNRHCFCIHYSPCLNIKTDPINKEISQINKQIALLKKENSQLMLTHTSLNTLDIIEKKAKQLGLKKSDVNSMQHVVLKP